MLTIGVSVFWACLFRFMQMMTKNGDFYAVHGKNIVKRWSKSFGGWFGHALNGQKNRAQDNELTAVVVAFADVSAGGMGIHNIRTLAGIVTERSPRV